MSDSDPKFQRLREAMEDEEEYEWECCDGIGGGCCESEEEGEE